MVKGISKQVIVVQSPEPELFEQAIFIVRDEYLHSQGIDQKELMRQANEAASGYLKSSYGIRHFRFIKPMLYGAILLAAIAIMIAAGYILF